MTIENRLLLYVLLIVSAGLSGLELGEFGRIGIIWRSRLKNIKLLNTYSTLYIYILYYTVHIIYTVSYKLDFEDSITTVKYVIIRIQNPEILLLIRAFVFFTHDQPLKK